MVNANEREQSEFNDALGYLNRLNYLFQCCTVFQTSNDLFNYSRALNRLFNELSTEMKEKELLQRKSELRNIFDLVNLDVKNREGKIKKTVDTQLYWKLNDFELWLRQVMRESGLQMRIQDDASLALR